MQFSLDPSSAGCTLSGNLVSFTGAGLCIVLANDPGNQNYGAAPQVQQQIQVAKKTQTITFTTTPPSPAPAGTTAPVGASSTSGLPVQITLDGASSGCNLNGLSVFLTTPGGVCLLDANQPGDTTYLAAPQVQLAIVIVQPQTVSFTNAPPGGMVGTTYVPAAQATSFLPVSF